MNPDAKGGALDTPRSKVRKPHGRHPDRRLTAVSIRNLKRPGRHADGHGLYLVIDPSGAKRWIWRGVIQGKRSDLGLGSADLVSLADARQVALGYRRVARAGGNPLTDRRRERRQVPTFKEAARTVHAEHRKTFRNPKHAGQWWSSLEADVFPLIGTRPVNDLGSGDVLRVLAPIWTVKPETARRLKQRIKIVFDWAKASGYCSGDNPTDGVTKVLPKHKGNKQHYAALPFAEVPAFVAALRADSRTGELVRLAFELLILTATRTNEVQLATWPDVDLATRTWTIPADRMKSGREHRVPLSPRAVEILTHVRALTAGDGFVFPGTKPGKPLDSTTFLKTARRVTTAELTPHGFRSSFRDWTEEKTTTPRTVVEAALAHVVHDKTEAAYRRTDLFDRRRELMDRWAQFATGTPATVISISA